jgi:hypothetical protein
MNVPFVFARGERKIVTNFYVDLRAAVQPAGSVAVLTDFIHQIQKGNAVPACDLRAGGEDALS